MELGQLQKPALGHGAEVLLPALLPAHRPLCNRPGWPACPRQRSKRGRRRAPTSLSTCCWRSRGSWAAPGTGERYTRGTAGLMAY